ncbi:Jag N-terminal domain-containing protein [Deltaproteobacteria bacterium]|nr:Jag N-terminal domain-containing protein [Deltaproteobacteria bacterium]
MKMYEFEGKTTEEAIEKASCELNLPVEELDIDIIEPGSAGIFGMVGTKKTKIKVNIPDMEDDRDPKGFEKAKEILENILNLIPVEATVNGEKSDGKIYLKIEGDTSGLLIGRKGKMLDALQSIVNKAVNKTSDKKIRVEVDSENYRQRHIESLTQLALKIGEKAKKFKKPFATNPLNPYDRRIVHLAIKNDEGLDTRSRGEGILKKVIIIPKK